MARRPSGRNKTQIPKVLEIAGQPIPVVKDAATEIYVAENGEWPKRPLTTLLVDFSWMEEGASFDLLNLIPGQGMGARVEVRVIEIKVVVEVHKGKYGQVRRKVLVEADGDVSFFASGIR